MGRDRRGGARRLVIGVCVVASLAACGHEDPGTSASGATAMPRPTAAAGSGVDELRGRLADHDPDRYAFVQRLTARPDAPPEGRAGPVEPGPPSDCVAPTATPDVAVRTGVDRGADLTWSGPADGEARTITVGDVTYVRSSLLPAGVATPWVLVDERSGPLIWASLAAPELALASLGPTGPLGGNGAAESVHRVLDHADDVRTLDGGADTIAGDGAPVEHVRITVDPVAYAELLAPDGAPPVDPAPVAPVVDVWLDDGGRVLRIDTTVADGDAVLSTTFERDPPPRVVVPAADEVVDAAALPAAPFVARQYGLGCGSPAGDCLAEREVADVADRTVGEVVADGPQVLEIPGPGCP